MSVIVVVAGTYCTDAGKKPTQIVDEDEEEKPAKQPKGCEEDPLADNRLDDGADGVYDGFDD